MAAEDKSAFYGWVTDADHDPNLKRHRQYACDAPYCDDAPNEADDQAPADARLSSAVGGITSLYPPVAAPRALPAVQGLYAQPNSGGGDCQFEALAQSLNQYTGVQMGLLAAQLRMFDMDLGSVTSAQLRDTAYSLFIKPLPELDAVLRQWRMFAADASMAGVYDHCKYLLDKRVELLTPQERVEFVNILTNRHVTWGDETSLLILERLLRIRVDVLTGPYLQKRDHCHPDGFEPIVYVCQNLHLQHYESVAWQGVDGARLSAWSKQETPEVILRLHALHCAGAKEAYIRMDAEWLAIGAGPAGPAPAADDVMTAHYFACRDEYSASRSADQGSCAALPMLPYACPETAVAADGGWQYPGEMGPAVFRLQCGLRVYPSLPVAASVAAVPHYATQIPNVALMRLWA